MTWPSALRSAAFLVVIYPAVATTTLPAPQSDQSPMMQALMAGANVVPPMDPPSTVILPQHQSNMSPAMQALQQIIDANPGIDFQVSNVAVSGATRQSAFAPSYPGTPYEQPAQVDALKNADIVINGFGGNDVGFPNWANSLIRTTPDSGVPALYQQTVAPFFTNGVNLQGQSDLLNYIAATANPGASVITVGYPNVFPDGPTSWGLFPPIPSLGQNAATYSNLIAQNLSADNQNATAMAYGVGKFAF